MTYEKLCAEIKDRLMTIAPAFAYVAHGRDKPDVVMGISNVEQQKPSERTEEQHQEYPQNDESAGDLDAMSKGKGKGKGKSDQCLRCNGKGHYSLACPIPRDSTDTRVCDGCGGKGHLKWQCPTANPALKGQGKDKGQGGQKGAWKGKGKCKGYKGG